MESLSTQPKKLVSLGKKQSAPLESLKKDSGKKTLSERDRKIIKVWDDRIAADPEMKKLKEAAKSGDNDALKAWSDRYHKHGARAKTSVEVEERMQEGEK